MTSTASILLGALLTGLAAGALRLHAAVRAPVEPRRVAATAVAAAVAFMAPGLIGGHATLGSAPLLAWLFPAAAIDLRHRVIPDRLLLIALLPWPVLTTLGAAPGLTEALLGAGAGVGGMALVRRLSRLRYGRPGLGLGDVKLAAPLGLYLGTTAWTVLLLAFVLGGALGLAGLLSGRLGRETPVPFVPFVTASALLHLLLPLPWSPLPLP